MHLSKHLPLFYRVFLILLIAITSSFYFSPSVSATASFVKKQDTQLMLDGKPYRFTGVNAYELGTKWQSNAGCGPQVDDLDSFFSQLRPHSIIRMWAFQGSIGTNVNNRTVDFAPLDRVITSAEKHGHKLILALSGQSGTCDDGHWKDLAWYSGGYNQSFNDDGRNLAPLPYIDYVRLIVTRYKNNPTIAMWEPVSEPEASNCQSGYTGDSCYGRQVCNDHTQASQALRYFFDTVGTEIKRIDPNHLISSGVIGDGQCGATFENYRYIHESAGIDVASFHDYGRDTDSMPGDTWNGLQKRIDQMKIIKKPIIIGEAGINASDSVPGCKSTATRRDQIKAKMDAQFKAGVSGYLLWNWQPKSTGCNHDLTSNDPSLSLIKNYPLETSILTTTQNKLGGLNLTAYCLNQKLPFPSLKNNSWTCDGTTMIQMTNACEWQYKNVGSLARQDVQGNPYSWSCYQTNVTMTPVPQSSITPTPSAKIALRLGGMNLSGYCGSINKSNPIPAGNNWTCGLGGATIVMTSACRWQYKIASSYAKQESSGNPYSWSCYT